MDTSKDIYLQLGDIIQLNAPTNPDLNQKIFIIDYIDNDKIKIMDEDKKEIQILNIQPNGQLSDESITSISLLNRASTNSYAKQNDLLPDKWIDVHFGGDLPVIITGLITNLEEDMIEIEIMNEKEEKELIYIDFGYKGIPEDIDIDKIVLRNKPESIINKESDSEIIDESKDKIDWPDKEEGEIYEPETHVITETIQIPVEQVKEQLKAVLLEADQINFGPTLKPLTTFADRPDEQKRYSIENQANDLQEDLLASIPNDQRTRRVTNNIHIMVERFKQLRNTFSTFDENYNASMPKYKGADYKPLVDKINNLNYKLCWILPIAQNIKKLYDLDIDINNNNSIDLPSDILPLTLANSRIQEDDLRELYTTNTDNFSTYMNKLNPYLTPFTTNYNAKSITVKHVLDNFDTVIDNLDKFYSSIAKNDTLKRTRFLITRYNLGLSKLQTTELTSIKMKTKMIPMTNNDLMSVKSMLTLPEPVVFFSNIHLPATTIYDKTNLNKNYLHLWKILRENTSITTKYIDNLDSNIEFDEKDYLKNKIEYLLDEENNDPEKFEKFLKIIIPKTRILFNLIKKYIHGKLSLISVLNYLQPYLVYIDDISFKQYEEITNYIDEQILEYTKNFALKKEMFNKLTSVKRHFHYESIFSKILQGRKNISNNVLENYGLNTSGKLYAGSIPTDVILSTSEIIKYMNQIDYTKSFNTSITLLNLDLFTPFDFDDLLEEKTVQHTKELDKAKKENECSQYVLAKRYISLEDVTADNDIPIYFDKKYDPTVYDIINEYQFEQSELDEPAFKNFLIEQLIKNIGLSRSEAKYEATSMIEKKRLIQDAQYAVLEVDNIDDVKYYYYKRENNIWVRDESIPENSFFGTNELFCNIQQKCIQINKKCADDSLGSEMIKKELIQEMYDEFDSTYIENIEKHKEKINELFIYEIERVTKLRKINRYLLYKYENENEKKINKIKYDNDDEVIISPHLKLLNIIRGTSDFVTQQHLIVKFVNKYTRTINTVLDTKKNCKSSKCENACQYWLYCIDTNTPILPTFIYKLATVYLESGNYNTAITVIKNQQGIEQDDIVVDEHSGLVIDRIALHTDEGYDESGFKKQSREILEMNAGDVIFQSTKEQNLIKKELLANPKGKIINNVITTLSNNMGIVLNNYRENIIQHTLLVLEETVDSQDVYERKNERKAKEGKKITSYNDHFNKSLLSYTLAYTSIYISTSIPSLQTKKTFPGCKRSLDGYPIAGEENLSNIQYIACVAAGIKTKMYPWKALPKSADKIASIIKNMIDGYILKQGEIQMLINEKRNYLLQNEDNQIPIDLDIKKWINFLPPLQDITNKTPANLSDTFRNALLENLKIGSKSQFEQLRTLNSKIIYFSMSVIQSIQTIVKKESPLLMNANYEPFLQNACCNTGEYKTLDYFMKKDSSIRTNNDIVSYLYNINFDMMNMAQPTLLVDPQDSKIVFPPISSEFSENTIYRAFIEFCNFSTDIPINNKLVEYCITKSDDYDKNKSLKENIEILKKEGKKYSLDSFNNLLNAVNKMNIVHLNLHHKYPSSITHMRDLIQHMIESDNAIDTEFLNLFKNILDSYDIENTEDNKDVRNLRNYLGENIELLQNNIINYITNYANLSKNENKKMVEFIKNIMNFNTNGTNFIINNDDETLYQSILFIKNAIHNLINVFPNIIMNSVNYSSVKIPKHWKLSEYHEDDIKDIIIKYYSEFKKFYNDTTIKPYFNKNEYELKDLLQLINFTNLHANIINLKNNETFSILDNKTTSQLFHFYFLFVINHLFVLTDDRTLLHKEIFPSKEENIIAINNEIDEDEFSEVIDVDIVRGEQRQIREKIANITTEMLKVINNEKKKINLNAQMIKEKITQSKDKERNNITSTLRDMTKEERDVEDLLKNNRLGKWNKGLQKGLTQYVGKTYDEEREEREQMEILEQRLENNALLGQALIADQEIALLEQEENQIVADRIDDDVFDMSGIPDDDNVDEYVDDSYRLEYEDE